MLPASSHPACGVRLSSKDTIRAYRTQAVLSAQNTLRLLSTFSDRADGIILKPIAFNYVNYPTLGCSPSSL